MRTNVDKNLSTTGSEAAITQVEAEANVDYFG